MRVSATAATSVASPAVPPRARSGLTAAVDARRAATWLPWLTGVLTLVAALHAIEPLPVGVFYDDAQYLVLAKALATGNGYRFLNLPGAPAATHFPPGYPAFLAVLWRIAPAFPENVALFKFANALLLAIVAVLICALGQRLLTLPRWIASVAALAGTATIPSLVLSSAIMSEPLFLALLLPLLLWAERETGATDRPSTLRTPLALGVATGLLILVRTHGLALVGAVVLTYLLRRRWREAAAFAAAALLVVAPWMAWVAVHNDSLPPLVRGAYGSYLGWLVAGWRVEGLHLLGVTVADNLATVWMTIARSIAPGGNAALSIVAGAIYLALAAPGVERTWRRARVLTLFVAFYLAIVLVWPFSPLRFLWGIWPLLMLLPAAGVLSAWESQFVRQHVAARRGLLAASAALALGIAAFNVRGYVNAWWSSNARFHARRVLPQLSWVARATRPEDLIAADAEAAVYLYTGRHAVPLTTFTAAEYARERTTAEETQIVRSLLTEYRPRFVLVTSTQLMNATARIAHEEPYFISRIDSLGVGAVYRLCTRLATKSLPNPCE